MTKPQKNPRGIVPSSHRFKPAQNTHPLEWNKFMYRGMPLKETCMRSPSTPLPKKILLHTVTEKFCFPPIPPPSPNSVIYTLRLRRRPEITKFWVLEFEQIISSYSSLLFMEPYSNINLMIELNINLIIISRIYNNAIGT